MKSTPAKAIAKPAEKVNVSAEVERMASLGAPVHMIADALGISEKSVHRKFDRVLRKARALRRVRLLGLQWASAEKGNPALLIWLGKNELAQRCQRRCEHVVNQPV